MPRQLWIADACRRWGLVVHEVAGWQTRGKEGFNPKAALCHHTAGPATGDYPSLKVVVNGRPDVPGPLANVGLGRTGTVYVIAAGKANHAGVGRWPGLAGSSEMFGIEAESVGTKDDWTPAQRLAYPMLVAALLDGIGRDASWCIAHKEWAPERKIDPAFWNMDKMRGQVQNLLDHGALPPPPPEEDDVSKILEVPNSVGGADLYHVAGTRAVHVGTAGLAGLKRNGVAVEKWDGTAAEFIDAFDLSGQPVPR